MIIEIVSWIPGFSFAAAIYMVLAFLGIKISKNIYLLLLSIIIVCRLLLVLKERQHKHKVAKAEVSKTTEEIK